MAKTVLLGDPSLFEIRWGSNPHTRDWLGRRKKVDRQVAMRQWATLKSCFEQHKVRAEALDPVKDLTGMVFPANAGFRYGKTFYLSNLNPARSAERDYYRAKIESLGLPVKELPSPHLFEGEADFIPVGDPSGDPARTVYLFTYGQLERQRWVFRLGFPPYRRIYGLRSDYRVFPALRAIVHPLDVLMLELIDEKHYHGDTVLCPFGPRLEYLLVYAEKLAPESRTALQARFGERLIFLSREDGDHFGANSFQISTEYYGSTRHLLLMPDGLSLELYQQIRSKGVIPCPVDVSEFLEKGGGALKCMLQDLGEI